LLKSKPVFTYNLLNLRRTRWEGPTLSPGKHTIEYTFKYDGLGEATLAYNNNSGVGRGGTGTLIVDGTVAQTLKQEGSLPLVKPLDITFDIGRAGATSVNDKDYQAPFDFTGTIDKIVITREPPKLTPADIKKLEAGNAAASD
jgi:arylsulfatase